jgi:hypothetical protein
MNLHLFGATEDGDLWHTIANLQEPDLKTSEKWGDVDRDGATGRPGKGRVLDSACAMDVDGNFHVLVVTDEDDGNKLWHAIRPKQKDKPWKPFEDVERNGAGQAGPGDNEDIVAVTAATTATRGNPPDLKLHIFAATQIVDPAAGGGIVGGRLFHAVWIPATKGTTIFEKGQNGQDAKFAKKFTEAKIPVKSGVGKPGRLKTLESTYLR